MNSETSRYWRKADIKDRFGLSDAQLHRLIAAGRFPKPIYLGPRSPRWAAEAIASFDAQVSSGGLFDPAEASNLTSKARTAYQAAAKSGALLASRRKKAAEKAAQTSEVAA